MICQGVLRAAFPGSKDVVTGIPDFLIKDVDSYRIRECKLSRSMEEGKHPEIALQLQTYGWLFEKTFEHPPAALEAFLGSRTIDSVAYRGADYAVRELGQIRGLALLAEEPWEPVGWAKCGACPFQERCWTRAEKSHDVAVVYKVDKGTARALRDKGITTYDQLLETMDARTLRQLKRPWGSGEQRVGKAAERILVQASAIFEEYGDIPFVHWADYEKTRLKSYIVKFGDPGRVAARVLDKCFDLLTAVRRSIALPVPSYIRAGEKDDEGERARIMDEILRYNEEDLQATWAVFRWAEANQRIP